MGLTRTLCAGCQTQIFILKLIFVKDSCDILRNENSARFIIFERVKFVITTTIGQIENMVRWRRRRGAGVNQTGSPQQHPITRDLIYFVYVNRYATHLSSISAPCNMYMLLYECVCEWARSGFRQHDARDSQ